MLPLPEIRRRLAEQDPRYHHTFWLRTISTVFSLIAFSLFAASIGPWNANFFHEKGPNKGDWQDGLMLAPLLIALLYNIGSVALAYGHRRAMLVPPFVDSIIDFLIWALLVPAITFSAWGGLFRVWRSAMRNADGSVSCNVMNSFSKECSPILYSIGSMELAGVVFSCFVWLIHFTLFVISMIKMRRIATGADRTRPGQEKYPSSFTWVDREMGGIAQPTRTAARYQ